MNASPDDSTVGNGAGDSGHRYSVDPIVAAGPIYDLSGKGPPAFFRAANYVSCDKTLHLVRAGQTVSAKYIADQANTQSFCDGSQCH